ncbi:MAG TPA: phosphatidylglycerophosphatase A [Lacunisphaera sp.]|jgi:phosphatidylglycerophosphatase A
MKTTSPKWLQIFPDWLMVGTSTLGPIGMKLPAPGTWGSLAGILYALVFFRRLGWEQTVVWTIIFSVVAVFFTGEAARRMGRTDPGEVILDEFVVMPLVFLGWHAGYPGRLPEWVVVAAGFGLFRLFDILKPLGISRLQNWPDGWGIVADDFAAALVACGTLHLGAWLWALR